MATFITPSHIFFKLNFCSMAWALNFKIYLQDTMNIITMHDFISQNCDSIKENIKSVHFYDVAFTDPALVVKYLTQGS